MRGAAPPAVERARDVVGVLHLASTLTSPDSDATTVAMASAGGRPATDARAASRTTTIEPAASSQAGGREDLGTARQQHAARVDPPRQIGNARQREG